MGDSGLFSQIIEFFRELIASLGEGYLFFGSPLEIVRYILDILIVTFMFYWLLIFIRQTRAWQLIKGIGFVLVLVLVMSLFGFQMISFIFNRLLYVFAIFFIILFQPEFRRVLESVGLRTSGSLKHIFKSNEHSNSNLTASLIHEICYACKEMCRTYTGALILIERDTKLDELLNQENVVKFESTVTNSVLQSIFYKGSPMHDGGLLIRNGMIVAARCHVPLSVTMHNLERSGTRHRAAVGASEMGDCIAVVVSEERGKCSIAVNGKLFEMSDEKELEANLAYLLGVSDFEPETKGIGKVIKRFKKHKNVEVRQAPSNVNEAAVPAAKQSVATESSGVSSGSLQLQTQVADVLVNSKKVSPLEKTAFLIISLILSFGLWMYIQINNNPVVQKTITVPISYSSYDTPENIEVSYPIDQVELEVVGRQNVISSLTPSDIIVSIDYSSIRKSDTGVVELPITVSPKNPTVYFRITQQLPETVSVTVYSTS